MASSAVAAKLGRPSREWRQTEDQRYEDILAFRYPNGWEYMLEDAGLVYEIVYLAMSASTSGQTAQAAMKQAALRLGACGE